MEIPKNDNRLTDSETLPSQRDLLGSHQEGLCQGVLNRKNKTMSATERDLANKICHVHGETLVEKYCSGATVSGISLGNAYMKHFAYLDFDDAWKTKLALEHWVEYAGFDCEGLFRYKLSGHILNC